MSLAQTSRSISAVTRALRERIATRTGVNVTVGRPEQNSGNGRNLNLFLYEVTFDPHLKNTPLDDGQKPPLWMVLKYILTPFDIGGESDSSDAHEDLGAAIRAISEDDLLKLDGLPANLLQALGNNPEELRVTFDESSLDLLAKVMQGSDEKLRLSIAFQVRPVMIASVEPAEYSLLVGIDYTNPPALTEKYVGLDVIPSLGALVGAIEPTGFEIGEEVMIEGNDLHLSGLSVRLGTVDLGITMQQSDKIKFVIDDNFVNGATISAGSQPVTVVQTLPTGKQRKSNMIVGNLVPTITLANVVSTTIPASPPNMIFATIDINGVLLGAATDDVVLALYQNGKIVKMFDELEVPPGAPPPQTARRLVMTAGDAVPQGEYFLILRVNSQQAPQSPLVNLV